jgi:hypothetical protein
LNETDQNRNQSDFFDINDDDIFSNNVWKSKDNIVPSNFKNSVQSNNN